MGVALGEMQMLTITHSGVFLKSSAPMKMKQLCVTQACGKARRRDIHNNAHKQQFNARFFKRKQVHAVAAAVCWLVRECVWYSLTYIRECIHIPARCYLMCASVKYLAGINTHAMQAASLSLFIFSLSLRFASFMHIRRRREVNNAAFVDAKCGPVIHRSSRTFVIRRNSLYELEICIKVHVYNVRNLVVHVQRSCLER